MLTAAAAGVGARAGAEPVISEFMASNKATLVDDDGAYSDWIELYNPDPAPVDLRGWFLTDRASNLTKWEFPAVSLPAGGYLVVFASGNNRRDPLKRLHTNFSLNADGEYLALVKPDGLTIASDFGPQFPAQADDVSYGSPSATAGAAVAPAALQLPTPGGPNSAALPGRLAETVSFSRNAGPFRSSFSLELVGGSGDHRVRYTVTSSSAAASQATDPTSTSPVYSGPITITGSTLVKAAVFSADGTSRGPIAAAYYARLSPNVAGFASQLPVLVLDSMGSGSLLDDGIDHPSWIYSYASRGGAPTFNATPELVSALTMTVRGSSSADFPKKGYNIEFTDATGKKRAEALLDLPAYEKWALVGAWAFDFSHLNNAFVYSLSNQMGRWAPRTRFVEVFVNANGGDVDLGDYVGIYAVTDRVDVEKGRVDITPLSPDDTARPAVTGGYVFKIDAKDQGDIGWTTRHNMPGNGTSSVVLVYPKAENAAAAQVEYLRDYVQQMEDALYADQAGGFAQRTYLDYIDRDSWVDHHILNTFVCNPDAFTRSAYFTKDRDAKLRAGPVWDFDRALGSYWDERSFRWDVWNGVGGPDVWQLGWWGVLARDPEFMQDWIDRWQSLRRNELSNPSLISLVESLGAQIGQDAVTRDANRWPDNVSPYGSYANQLDHMKGWVTLRAQWIDSQFVAAPTIGSSGGSVVFTAPAGAQLVYTLDGSDPRSLNNEIAPNALTAATSLSVSPQANVHVRSYRADLRGTFPGSPWSSAVATEAASPLSPRARLINISARAIVGTGENALIAGVIVADTASKRYLARAVGPGLASFGATSFVPDPQLSVFAPNGVEQYRNLGWETARNAALLPSYSKRVGAFPLGAGSRDSALAEELSAGAYTVQITTPTGQGGVALAELYELDANGRTVNLSTRARVSTGDGVLIGGFVVQGPAYKRMLIRAVGPTLRTFGVGNALLDPILTIYSGQTVVATNDRWDSGPAASMIGTATKSVGAFALAANSQDAALLITLAPGAYTVEVRGKASSEGVALLEIYEIP